MLRVASPRNQASYTMAPLEDPNEDLDDECHIVGDREEVHIELQVTDLSGGSSCDSDELQGSPTFCGSGHIEEGITHFKPGSISINDVDNRFEVPMDRQNYDEPQRTVERRFILQQEIACQRRQQQFAALLGILPVAFFSFEMIPSWCQYFCLQQEHTSLDSYFFTAAFCGGLGAALYGSNPRYLFARFVGGSISALGSLFTNWMLLSSMSSHHPSSVAVIFGLIGLFVGSMPGVVAFFVLKILTDECHLSDIFMEDEFDFDDSERSRLTEPLTSPLDTADNAVSKVTYNEAPIV